MMACVSIGNCGEAIGISVDQLIFMGQRYGALIATSQFNPPYTADGVPWDAQTENWPLQQDAYNLGVRNASNYALACGRYANLSADIRAGTAPPGTAVLGPKARITLTPAGPSPTPPAAACCRCAKHPETRSYEHSGTHGGRGGP